MPQPELFVDRAGTAGNTNVVIPIPAHPNGSKAVVGVMIEGDGTPVTSPPGWTVEADTYLAVSDQTFVSLTHQNLPETETVVQVSWTGVRPAAGVVVVSPDAPTLQAGIPTTVHGDTGVAGGVAAVDGDLPVIIGGTDDGAPTRYPNGVTTLDGVNSVVWLDDQQTGVDVWAILGSAELTAGATGNQTYELGGTGNAPAGATAPFLASSVTAFAPRNVGVASLQLPLGALNPNIGDVLILEAVGQAPASFESRPLGYGGVGSIATTAPATTHSTAFNTNNIIGHLAMIHVATDGAAGAITIDNGFEVVADTQGQSFLATKVIDGTEPGVVTVTTANAIHMRMQVVWSNSQSDGVKTVTTATSTTANYGPHDNNETTAHFTSDVFSFWRTDVNGASVTDMSPAGQWGMVTEPRPATHTGEYGVGARNAGAAGVNPSGTATVSAAATTTITTVIANPRPMFPTDLKTPIAEGSGIPWNTFLDVAGNDTPATASAPSTYIWWKVVDQGDLDDGVVNVYPTTDLGEFSAELFLWPSIDPAEPFDGGPLTNGSVFSGTVTTPALTTTAADTTEQVSIFAVDFSTAPQLITSTVMTGMSAGSGALMYPSGQVVATHELARPTPGPGAARTGTIENTAGPGFSVRHTAYSYGLRARPTIGSWQTSQLVVFGEVPNPGPTTVIQTPDTTACITDPVTVTGRSTGQAPVVNVDLELRRLEDNQYWNGTAWQAAVTTVPAVLAAPGETDTTWTYNAAGAFTEPGRYEATVAGTDNGVTEVGVAALRAHTVTATETKKQTITLDDFDRPPQNGDLIRWVITAPGPTEHPTFTYSHPGAVAVDHTGTGYNPRIRIVEQTHAIGTTTWTFTGSANIRVAGFVFDGSTTAATTYSTPVTGFAPVDPSGQANPAGSIGVSVASVNYIRGQIAGAPAGHTTLFNTGPTQPRQLSAAVTELDTAGTYDPPASPYSGTTEETTVFTIVAAPNAVTNRTLTPGTYTAPPRTWCVEGPAAIGRVREPKLGAGGRTWVEIVGRYGGVSPGVVIARLPATTDGWFERQLDATSEAEIVARYSTLDLRRCCDDLAAIETWAHEIRVWWDGLISWVGPITHIEHLADGIAVRGHDRSYHTESRVLGEHTHTDLPLSTIFTDYWRDAYQQDPWGMTSIVQPVPITGTRTILNSDGEVAATALEELSRTGIDWTVTGTTLLVGGTEVPTPAITTLTDEHFTRPLQVVEDGNRRATAYVMSGNQVAGAAELRDDDDRRRRYGLITGRAHDAHIQDQPSVNAAARTRLEYGHDPVYIDPGNATLRPTAPVALADLVPGARVQLQATATCRVVSGLFRLTTVRANLDGTVSVSFQPLGTTVDAL